jgi:hypothetical protein
LRQCKRIAQQVRIVVAEHAEEVHLERVASHLWVRETGA